MTAVTFATPHVTLTTTQRSYVTNRAKGLRTLAPALREVEVHVNAETNHGFTVEVLVHRDNAAQPAANGRGHCLEAALDRALHTCRVRLAREHDRKAHRRFATTKGGGAT